MLLIHVIKHSIKCHPKYEFLLSKFIKGLFVCRNIDRIINGRMYFGGLYSFDRQFFQYQTLHRKGIATVDKVLDLRDCDLSLLSSFYFVPRLTA